MRRMHASSCLFFDMESQNYTGTHLVGDGVNRKLADRTMQVPFGVSVPRWVLAFLFCFGVLTVSPTQAADNVVLYHGKVFTGEPEHPYAEAVAIRGDKIVAVGAQVDVEKAAGTDAEKIDLQGKTLLPGLIDSHTHVMDSSTVLTGADVDDKVHTLDDLVAFVAEARHSGRGMRGRFLEITSLSLDF